MIVWGNAKDVAERYGRRYCGLAMRGQIGTQWREVPESEYWLIQKTLRPYDSAKHLSHEDLQEIVRELAGLKTHIYAITQVERAEGEVSMDLRFVGEGRGV